MNSNKALIFVIDDDPVIRELVTFNLQVRGYEVMAFSNGMDALQSIEETRPDLVILDVIMPDLDGWEMCKILRDTDETLPIIMLTALDTARDKLIGRSILRADAYVTKPFDIDHLISSVKKLIE
ncbi:response regulator [Chitinispirillales bacterium ANBcel5]|uniref:response regulator transcription factor n=1 Tax=Cellulosispirillum alkaliphilum TaxID=3039283 RepID=UPI002A500AE8|nr:response regulator [Chitinispirillales bacterium ANBcel5]